MDEVSCQNNHKIDERMMNGNNQNHKKKEPRVKRSILTNMIIVPFIPFLLAIGVSFYFFTTALENKTVNTLKRIVQDHCDMIESFLVERTADLELITNTYSFEDINATEAIHTIFKNLKDRSSAFVDLGLFDSQGIHIRYTGKYPLKGKAYKNEVWFKKVMQTGYYISDVFLGYRNVPHFIIAVRQDRGSTPWVLRATIDTLFFDTLVSKVRIGKTGEAYILNKTGIAQTLRRSGGIGLLEKDHEFSGFPKLENSIHTFIKSDAAKDKHVYATTWLKNREWLLVVRQEKRDAYKYFYSALYINILIMVIGGAIIIIIAVYTTEHILKRIAQLGMEKESLGNQLIRATQLAEIGEMAAGFAHEINNPLQIIKSEYTLIETLFDDVFSKDEASENEDIKDIEESLDQIKLQVNRCSEITHAILKFGRKNEIKKQVLHPFVIIPEIIRMIEKKAMVSGIEIVQHISKKVPGFMGDPSQFQQVILNLLNNAMDAIQERHGSSGGRLTIEVCRKNEYIVEINITDNGIGISPENIEKIFSPFFTTKPVGKGTGLGLSVCFGIIENFGGTMDVKSQLNIGTTFVIGLPVNH
ncbi:PAS domain-containing sensor histidine kinase [Desulfobacula sp.]|uniref:sensor histidine kinase n=1 Tax=Desulfobacula sp. TaxID=2593537 RepID=UPI0026119E4A|nr:PAS domain-containing sensor histidine kinase [Desulfobacula sp.]